MPDHHTSDHQARKTNEAMRSLLAPVLCPLKGRNTTRIWSKAFRRSTDCLLDGLSAFEFSSATTCCDGKILTTNRDNRSCKRQLQCTFSRLCWH